MERIASTLFTNTTNPDHRSIVWLENLPQGWCESSAELVGGIGQVNANTSADRADRITHLLGNEYTVVLQEIRDPMDAGLLAAMTGTVTAGGLLLIALDWHAGTAPTSPRHGFRQSQHTPFPAPISRFGQRFYRLLNRYEALYPDRVHQIRVGDNDLSVRDIVLPLANAVRRSTRPARSPQLEARQQQDDLLRRACHFLANHSSGYMTLTGKRGRGKSTLLARIANWLDDQRIDYAITAANASALTSFHKHAQNPANVILYPSGIHTRVASVLLVDEAANLSLGVLRQLMAQHERVIFCTTVEGYESAGRAFDTRFIESIQATGAPYLNLNPTVPWRWGAGDPLERLINELVAGDTSRTSDTSDTSDTSGSGNGGNSAVCHDNDIDTEPVSYCAGLTRRSHRFFEKREIAIRELTQQQLTDDERLLRRIFHLLRATHYQTTVQDLQHILDGNDVRLWVLHAGEEQTLAGVAVVGLEGNIDDSLHQAVVDKHRRLPHQLLPQLLAQMANSSAALSDCYARVIRISVAATFRQQGFGSHLLTAIEAQMASDTARPIAALGASFAADPVSLAFWRANGYSEFHRGFRRNPRTGRQAVAVLKTFNATVESVRQQAAIIHEDNQWWHTNTPAKAEVVAYVEDGAAPATDTTSDEDRALLVQFARAHRSVHDTHAALCRLAERQLISLKRDSGHSNKAADRALRKQVNTLFGKGLL